MMYILSKRRRGGLRVPLLFCVIFSVLLFFVTSVYAQEDQTSEVDSGNVPTEAEMPTEAETETETETEMPTGAEAETPTEAEVPTAAMEDEESQEKEISPPVRASIQEGVPSFYSDGNITYARSNTKIRLSAAERVSSVEKIEYKIDQSEYRLYSEPITIPEEGQHQISYRSLDVVGNMEFENVVTVIIDDTPPTTFVSSNVSFIKVKNDLFVSGSKNPQLYIKATDFYSGVKAIEYYIKNGDATPEFGAYSSAVPLGAPGEKIIVYRAIDNLGNVSESREIKIITDATPPTVSINFGKNLMESGDKKYSPKNNKLILKASDEGSGVASIYVKLSNKEGFQPYAEPITITGDGAYAIEAKSVDRAGNESVIAKESIIVDAEPPQTNLEFLNVGGTSDASESETETETETENNEEAETESNTETEKETETESNNAETETENNTETEKETESNNAEKENNTETENNADDSSEQNNNEEQTDEEVLP